MGAAPLVDEPERFVAALQAWPALQLDACVYAAGVMARIQAEIEAPGLAASLGLEGQVRVGFVPALARVDITEETTEARTPTGRLADGAAREVDQKAARLALTNFLRDRADRALQRYARPADIPAGWRADAAHALKPQR